MFYRFPYIAVGFSDEEWEGMPRGHRVLIRDWYLNGRDRDQTLLYDEFDTYSQVWRIEKKYKLKERPIVKINVWDLNVPE